ncbi:hypothetical protein BDV98DRAFT_591866 [Pterulicium gracile]|uniref:Uncharacterized protein n=1 Tax=Pterulicium gracile TaxID=1884261 RepID=A0A5C3QMP2_9AGAR|nr:hypothetical protein BDV98DRAFT_591866 [Pterula gracilis]
MTYSASASEAQRKRYSAELAAYTLRQFNAARASTDDAQREEGSRTSSPSSSPSRGVLSKIEKVWKGQWGKHDNA